MNLQILLTQFDSVNFQKNGMEYALQALYVARVLIKDKQITNVEKLQKKLTKVCKVIMATHNLEFTIENVFRKIQADIKSYDSSKKEIKMINKYSTLFKYDLQSLSQMQNIPLLNRQHSSIESNSQRLIPTPVLSNQQSSENSPQATKSKLRNNFQRILHQEKTFFKQSTLQDDLDPEHKLELSSFEVQRMYFLEKLDELENELKSGNEEVNNFALKHMYSNEVILIYGYSSTVKEFILSLKEQASKNVKVIVLQPELEQIEQVKSSDLAEQIAKYGINVQLAPLSTAYALMTMINKIFIGAHGIMKNGGILGSNGLLLLTTAAKSFNIPVIVLSNAIKLTEKYPFEQNTFNELYNPQLIFNDESISSQLPTAIISRFDYIPPEYITLFITNRGEYTPAYMYRLFNEYYIKEE